MTSTIAGIAAVTLVTAAFAQASDAEKRASKPSRTTHTVEIQGMKFTPEKLTVKEGDTVVWTNKDIVPHTVHAASKAFSSPVLADSKSFKWKAKGKGQQDYVCTLHPTMKGIIVVE